LDDSFEKVRPRLEKSQEYLAVTSDELRRSAFDKYIKRLKDKEEELEKDRLKRRGDRHSVDRHTHRERERSDRSHRGSRHGRPSRSPEPDAYEADRRKAIADREKNYRKTNVADSLLSPPRRSRDREIDRPRDTDRSRDIDRPPHRSRRDDSIHYDRDRRDPRDSRDPRDVRENDREKLYRRRGDPRGSIDELPWGDDRPVSRRRRADSMESSNSTRASKVRRL
jgi:pre-mRNA-processing factor 40